MKNLPVVLPGLGYLLISLIVTWPLLTHLQGWVPGFGDWGQNMWALWWTRQALLSLAQTPFFTRYLFYPEGVTLLFHPVDISDGLLALPLYGLLGGDVTYNLMILLSFVLGGWGTYLLALDLTGRRGAAFVAGLVFILSPYHFQRIDLGHLNLSTIQWIPFYTLFLLRFVRSGSRRAGLLAIFFLVFNALNSWYYVIYCGLLSLAVIFWPDDDIGANLRSQHAHVRRCAARGRATLLQLRNSYNKRTEPSLKSACQRAGRVGVVLLVALLMLSPLLIPMLRLLNTTSLIGEHNPLRHSVDLLSFWLPGPPSTWAGWFEEGWLAYAGQNREPGASAYLGYGVLGLSLLSLMRRTWRRQAGWWGLVAVGFTLLALGPQLQIDGQIYEIPLLYHLLATSVPLFAITGIPGRFVVMTSLALAILTAYGTANLVDWLGGLVAWSNPQRGREAGNPLRAINQGFSNFLPTILYGLVGLLIILEYLAVPLRLSRTEVAEFYQTLAADNETYAILDIKWDANFLMHAQTVHGKPLIGGWLARLPAEQAAYLDQPGLDKAFLYLLLGPDGSQISDVATIPSAIQSALAERNVRYIIDHDNLAGSWLAQWVGWPVVYEAEGMVVYGREE